MKLWIMTILIVVMVVLGFILIQMTHSNDLEQCENGCNDLGLEFYNYDVAFFSGGDCFCNELDGLPIQIS